MSIMYEINLYGIFRTNGKCYNLEPKSIWYCKILTIYSP